MPKSRLLLFGFLLFLASSFMAQVSFASTIKQKHTVNVSASVGEFYLDISGYVSPFASVVLSTDGVFMRATVADAQGNFSISGVLIKAGFSHFCLEAVDFKRVGESFTCINVPPANGSIKKDKIFLPPTLGLSKTSVAQGEEVEAFGYTMPNATVTLNLGKGKILTVLADSSGYYVFKIKNLPAGKYDLFATAHYKGQDSLSPTKKVQLHSLSLWEQILEFLRMLWMKLIALFTSLALGPLWLAIPILILIIILIVKLWPEKFTIHKKIIHHLHHYWEFQE